MNEELRLSELGGAVIDAAAQDLADYSVGFVGLKNTQCGSDAVLLGSGTLVSVGSIRAVLTAHHVVSILPTEGRLGFILGSSLQQHTVDIQGLTYLKIARGAKAADGPIRAPSLDAGHHPGTQSRKCKYSAGKEGRKSGWLRRVNAAPHAAIPTRHGRTPGR